MLAQVQRIRRLLEGRGGTLEIRCTSRPGHATELASKLPRELQAVLIAGGDGTVGEVLNGLAAPSPPLAILRSGTENLLAKELEMPTGAAQMAELLAHGEPTSMDVGVLNGRKFVAVAGIGFDAACVAEMQRVRRGHITYLDYLGPILRTFWSYRYPTLRVEADGREVFSGRGFALIGNIARYSAGLRILTHAKGGDGLLDLGVFPCSSRAEFVGHAARAYLRAHVGDGRMLYHTARSIRVESDPPAPVELDGELWGRTPAACSVVPAAVSFLRTACGKKVPHDLTTP